MTLMLLAALACKNDPVDSSVDDTQVNTDDSGTDDTGTACEAKPAEVVPEDESDEVYHRAPLEVAFTTPVPGATFALDTAAGGNPAILVEGWADTMDRVELQPQHPLEPLAEYVLDITVCGTTYQNTFTTSELGKPLTIGPEELLGNSYLITLEQVKFVKPDNVATLIKTFLDMPILVNVYGVDGDELTLVGAEGWIDSQDGVNQRKLRNKEDVPTWDFDDVDFSEAPFFKADSPGIVLVYDGVNIPIYDFHLEGTFNEDASAFGAGRLWGLADTRETAPLLNESDPNHVCDLVAGFGVECEPCPDGEVYCLYLQGEEIFADQVEVKNGFERIEVPEEDE